MLKRLALAGALAAAGLSLAGCADDYGYGGVAVGYGYPGYGYDGFYDGAFGAPYWGWYDDFYYPGYGVYVYDRYRRPYRWNGNQQRYWGGRLNQWRGTRPSGPEWRGFQGRGGRGFVPRTGQQASPGRRFGGGQPAAPAGDGAGQTTQGTRAPAAGGGWHGGGGGWRGGGGRHGGGGGWHGGGGGRHR